MVAVLLSFDVYSNNQWNVIVKVPVRLHGDDVTLTDAIKCSVHIDQHKGLVLKCHKKIYDPNSTLF